MRRAMRRAMRRTAGIAIIAVASVSVFFGPLGAWGLTGLGCCLVLLAYAAALVVRQRRA